MHNDSTFSAATLAHRICPLCEACCGLELRVEHGKVTSIRGHEADVLSRGYICPKAVALKDLHEDPDRLRAPLVKRNGRFAPASWDEAYTEIERRLLPLIAQHGRDAVAVVLGNPSAHKIGLLLYQQRLIKALGTMNIYSASTLDQMPKQLSCGLMFGHWLSIPVPDIERTQFLLILGANPMVSNGSLWTVPDFRGKAKALHARGGKIVVVDPRRSETAEIADRHLFIRPGADVFLLLGLVHTVFAENRVRLNRLAEHVAGLDALRDAVAPFAPARVAARCGIDAATIVELARTLASTERAAVYGRIGLCTQPYGTLCSWLVDVLNVVTGHLDEPGGAMFPKAPAFAANAAGKPGSGRGITTGRRTSRVSGAPEVFGELPMTCLAEEIETPGPGQVKALITSAANPVLSSPNGPRLAQALDQLELMVSLDIYVNETSRHAHVILPGGSPLEEMHYDLAFPMLAYRNYARASRAVLPRPPGQPEEWETLLRLIGIVDGKGAQIDVAALDDTLVAADVTRSLARGAEAEAQTQAMLRMLARWRGPERLLDLALRTGPYGDFFGRKPDGLNLEKLYATPDGIDLGPLQPRVPELLRTPSGKIELAPPSLLQDLQRAATDLSAPAAPLVIIGRRQVRSNNSWMHNLPTLAKGPFRCTALVHPDDAARHGLRDGSVARITGVNGAHGQTIEAQIEISAAMMPGVISLPHGWGHHLSGTQLRLAAERPGANINALFGTARDPLSGNAVLSGVPVEIAPVG